MQIRHKNNKKIIIIVIVLVAILIGGSITFALVHGHNSGRKSTPTKSGTVKTANKTADKSDGASQTDDDATETSESAATTGDPTNGGHTPIQYEGQGNNAVADNQLTGWVNTLSINNDTMMVRVTFEQLIKGDAKCSLTLTGPAGQTYTDTADIVNDPQSSSCYGWDIPVSKLGQTSGHWKATISVSGGDRSGTVTGEANL